MKFEERQRDLCLKCNRSVATCFCGFARPFDTNTRFVLLMHPKEFKRQKTGTGRLTKLSLNNSEIIMGVDFNESWRLKELFADARYFPVVLFPGRGSVNLSQDDALAVPSGKSLLIIIIDATWRLAKKIMYVSGCLHALPRICFTPPALSRFKIKKQPEDYCVSTIEAVHHLLTDLEKRGLEQLNNKHSVLIETIDSLVDFQMKYINSSTIPSRHFKSDAYKKRQKQFEVF